MTKTQTIFRAVHGKLPYFMMLRTTAQDSNLSFEARGLIAYLLSKPNDWEINKADLMREGDLGRTKMKRIMDELTTHEYMTITQERDEHNQFTRVIYTLYECPVTQNMQAGFPAANTKPAERETRRAGNDHQHNTESLQSTEKDTASAVGDDFKPIQALTVEYAYAGNSAKFGAAGDIAHWALCDNDKKVWSAQHPERPFTTDEWQAFMIWYSDKVKASRNDLAWPRNPSVWNDQAFQFRASPDYKRLMTPPAPPTEDTAAQHTRSALLEVSS